MSHEHRRPPDPPRTPSHATDGHATLTGGARPAAGRAADLRARRLGQDRRRPARARARRLGPRRPGPHRDPIGLPGLSEPETMRHYVRLSPEEPRHRPGALSAGLVHDEAQPAPQREDGAPAGLRRHPPAAAAVDRAGRAGADGPPGPLAEDPDRHARRRPVAQGRRPRRAVRPAGHPRRPRGRRPGPSPQACWCPTSAHGTNPATAAFVGYTVVEIAQTDDGRVDLADLAAKLGPDVAAIMVTNPNTCGLFERDILEIAPPDPRGRRLLLLRRRQLQRHRRPGPPGRPRRRRHAHQPAQDLLHARTAAAVRARVRWCCREALAPFAPAPWVVHGDDGYRAGRARARARPPRPSAACAPSTARWACTSAPSPT